MPRRTYVLSRCGAALVDWLQTRDLSVETFGGLHSPLPQPHPFIFS